jgi:hypothetical protein
MTPTVPRREFLMRALAVCSLPLALGRNDLVESVAAQEPATPDVASSRRAVGYLGESSLEAAQSIGRARLRALGVGETGKDILVATSRTLEIINRAATDKEAIQALTEAVRGDFVEARTLDVDGWVLSQTEVDLCVLTLLNPPAPSKP